MKVTPLDLRQQRFRTVMRGFDKTEVVALLTEAADDYEHALRETDRLQQELVRLEAALTEHREHERNLRNTLLTAQRLADEIKAAAEQDAKRIVREAEGRAELILQKAQASAEEVQREIDGLKMKRRDVLNSLDSTMSALKNAADYVRDQTQRDREDKVSLPAPWPLDAAHEPRPGDTRRLDMDALPKVDGH